MSHRVTTTSSRLSWSVLLVASGLSVTACESLLEGDKEESQDTGWIEGSVPTGSPPVVEWHVGEGTDGEEHVHEGMQTSDGGYIGIGQTDEASGGGMTDMLVVKVDPSGQLEWTRRLGDSGVMDVGIAILEVDDGYLAAGGLSVDGSQRSTIVKLNLDGTPEWTQHYHSQGASAVRGLDHMSDGRIAATGYYGGFEDGFVFISEESTGFLLVVDTDGTESMSVDLSVPQGTKVRQTEDGGFVVLSTDWVFEGDEDIQNAALVKTDSAGTVEWKQTYGGTDYNQAFDFDLADDGTMVIAGHTVGHGATNWDCLLTKVSANGEAVWTRRFGQPRGYDARYIHDECYGIRVDRDGSYVMAGGSGDEYDYSARGHASGPSDEWKGFVIKVTPAGDLDWMQVYGDGPEQGNNATEFLALTDDGGYLLLNDTDSAGPAEPNNFGFMKLSTTGR